MIEAYKKFWKNYANFTGRSSRSDYWWVVLANILIFFLVIQVLTIILASIFSNEESSGALVGVVVTIELLMFLAIIIPSLALVVRRLRDAGYHWACIFLWLVPFGGIVLLVFLCMPSKYPTYGQYPGYPYPGAPMPGQPGVAPGQAPQQGFANPRQPQQPVYSNQAQATNVSQASPEPASQAPEFSETPWQ